MKQATNFIKVNTKNSDEKGKLVTKEVKFFIATEDSTRKVEVDKGIINEILKHKKQKTKQLNLLKNATDDPTELEKIKKELKLTRKSVTNTKDHVGNDVFSVTRSIDENLTPSNSDEDIFEKQRKKT